MIEANRRQVLRFFEGLTAGAFPDDLFAPDLTCWTTAGDMDAGLYRAVPRMLKSLFQDGLAFHIDAIIAEADRAAAQVRSKGVFEGDQLYTNDYAFIFGFKDGRISSVAEHLNPLCVPEALAARMMAAMHG
ncbi:nuclear transport factor 2 family protein [Sphingobium tyrosinilyticum]|uniref:Nuclear transport factor 2 family protein n=1 Tax=Sphingobium tyrosinilyticum TaxID=2715436 RepID=A0ABV9EX93_9SPHN